MWWVRKLEQLQEIYLQSKKSLANVLPENKCIVIEVLLFIITLRYTVWIAKNKIFRVKIIEHTCKFMTTKWLAVYHTINYQIIWSNKPVILWIHNPNRKCFDGIIPPLLTAFTESVAYDSTTLVIFSLLDTLGFSNFKSSFKNKWTDSVIFLTDVENCSVVGGHARFVFSLQTAIYLFLLCSLQSIWYFH